MRAMIRADEYRDAGVLLGLTQHMEAAAGVRRAVAMMGAPRNLEVLRKMGLAPDYWPVPPKPCDLVVVAQADDEDAVVEALRRADAWLAARAIANSPLVKTAVHGGDPNWGRLIAAAGRSGAASGCPRSARAARVSATGRLRPRWR